MDFLTKVRNEIIKNALFTKEQCVFVACSGGVDSMVLLSALHALGYHVACGHVHHGLRKTADRDAAFVERFCKEQEIPFVLKRVDVKSRVLETKETTEEAARILRYRALCEAAREVGADTVALAHHQNDQAETVLFQMLRGSGLKGLSGMPARSERSCFDPDGAPYTVTFVRPFLPFSREEIAQYAVRNGISWQEDETNAQDFASRNKIRHEVLPAMENVRPDAVQKIAEAGALISEADAYFRAYVTEYLKNKEKCTAEGEVFVLETAPFRSEAPIVQRYVLTEVLRKLKVPMKDKTRKHIEALRQLFYGQTGAERKLPDGGFGARLYGSVLLSRSREAVEAEIGRPVSGARLETRTFPYKKGTEIPEKAYTKWFDCDKIKHYPILRTRETGDIFATVPGAQKKLKDYMIEEKIPRLSRASALIVADGKEVLWVVGRRISADYRVTDETKQILEITVKTEGQENE